MAKFDIRDQLEAIISTGEASGRFSPMVAEFLRSVLPNACTEIDDLRGVAGPDIALTAITEFCAMFVGWAISGNISDSQMNLVSLDIWAYRVKELLRPML